MGNKSYNLLLQEWKVGISYNDIIEILGWAAYKKNIQWSSIKNLCFRDFPQLNNGIFHFLLYETRASFGFLINGNLKSGIFASK